uniref:Uncharacterized protein n=1 Tax=Anguilla anguilla TaxID=7936 RepID=A0A0E9TLL3_ANGAN
MGSKSLISCGHLAPVGKAVLAHCIRHAHHVAKKINWPHIGYIPWFLLSSFLVIFPTSVHIAEAGTWQRLKNRWFAQPSVQCVAWR